ncbi:MAG: cytochrome c family protein [Ignavibacteria bacterium]|mgnify:CR=1 FL=1|nr:cytochrome c family protein [Ignavibacteria bacterium]
MKNFLLDYNLKVRLPILVFVILTVFVITYYASYAERIGVGYQPLQPIAFSHKLHAGEMKIDCRYCHSGVESSRQANIPSVNDCMNCHSQVKKDSPEIIKLTEYFTSGTPLQWKRVHRVPDFAYFNHSVHVNAGIDCSNCHGNVAEMEVVEQVKDFSMRACIDCHRNPQENIKNISQGKKDVQINNGPQNCSACHR